MQTAISEIEYLLLNQDAYRRMDWAHYHLLPRPTEFVVVYETPQEGVAVVHPTDHFMAMLMHGWLARRMRDLGTRKDRPAFDGSGELMPPMTEQEAIEFVAWKYVPIEVQRKHYAGNRALIVICRRSQLPERTYRDAWVMSDAA